jgi:ABC-type Fe3+-hydroxamate transport system substrate-binding protein
MKNIVAFVLLLVFATACLNPATNNKEPKSKSLRIVSLTPSVTLELMSLGLTDSIVGATSYCKVSEKKPELVVGSVTTVNTEKIVLLKPDIVFASALTPENTISTLRKSGLRVEISTKMISFENICKQYIEIGQLVGKKEFAENKVKLVLAKIDSLKKTVPQTKQKPKLFFQIGANPLFTVIPNTFMNDLVTLSGCNNIASDLQKGTITRESVILRNPDIIFVVTMGMIGDDEKRAWESFKNLSATKDKHIFIIDSNKACTPTLDTFVESLQIMIDNIYKK